MAIQITLLAANVDGSGNNLLYAIGTLTFSGNYVTGGDTMDFTTVGEKLSSAQIIQVFADSQNGNAGYYVPVTGAAAVGAGPQPARFARRCSNCRVSS
mgnify:CR=1 FL=1